MTISQLAKSAGGAQGGKNLEGLVDARFATIHAKHALRYVIEQERTSNSDRAEQVPAVRAKRCCAEAVGQSDSRHH